MIRSRVELRGRGSVKTAIFGGTFNPVHNGHLHLAVSVCAELGYDKVIFVPANLSPHKEADDLIANLHRLTMVRRAIADYSFLSVDECELDRGGVSYTIDTIRYLGSTYGRLGVIIGDDLVADYSSWRQASALALEADLILGRRKDDSASLPFPHQGVSNVRLPISSQLIRERLRTGQAVDYLIPSPVLSYIVENGLYQDR